MKIEDMLVRTLAKMAVCEDPGYRETLRNECGMLLQELEEQDDAHAKVDADNNLKHTITKMVHGIGIPAHIKGCRYVQEAIMIVVKDPNIIDHITKGLYPIVAKKFSTTPSRVERAIRHAVEVAWTRCDIDVLIDCFGNTIDPSKGKPTNSEFIAMVAEHIRDNM